MIYVDIFEKAYQFLQDEGIAARRHIELKQYTTLHIGGEAQILAEHPVLHRFSNVWQYANSIA